MNLFKVETPPNRVFGLDVLRAAAIFFPVFGHSLLLLPEQIAYTINEYFILDGVSLFFVLSGFLIGSILIKTVSTQGISGKVIYNFWIRRWFRTFPAYYFVLIIVFLLNICFTSRFRPSSAIQYFLFLQNLNWNIPGPFFPESWSLSVEEVFYIVTPLLLLGMMKVAGLTLKKALGIVIFLVVFAVLIFRLYRFFYAPCCTSEWIGSFYSRVTSRIDGIMHGVAAAYFNFYLPKLFVKYKKVFFFVGISLIILNKTLIFFFYRPRSAHIPERYHLFGNAFRNYVLTASSVWLEKFIKIRSYYTHKPYIILSLPSESHRCNGLEY